MLNASLCSGWTVRMMDRTARKLGRLDTGDNSEQSSESAPHPPASATKYRNREAGVWMVLTFFARSRYW